jgi:RNA polymerase sigma factor (sigma-70 family)
MASKQGFPIHRVFRKLIDQQRDELSSDQELLRRFTDQRDDDAFTVLVRRHGPMVLGVALRVLCHHQDAEDICQATFLILAQKANSVAWQDSVANWLYGVAYRLALQTRDAGNRRSAREAKVEPKPPPDALADITLRELQAVLDEELNRLPKKYRAPLVLCCLEGKARDEAAQYLGLPLAIVKSRLEAGREMIRTRLARRGLTLPAALVGVTLASGIGYGALPAGLARATSQAAVKIIAGQTAAGVISANVIALLKEGAPTMSLMKLKIAMAILLVGVLTSGVVSFAQMGPGTIHAQGENGPRLELRVAAASEGKKQDRVDRDGTPLPAGTLIRFGSVEMRHDDAIRASALSPDGKILATTSGRSVVLWDLAAGKPLHRFVCDDHWMFVTPGIAFSPDGRYLGYVQDANFACVWNVKSGKEVARFEERARRSSALCKFTPDSKEFVLNEGMNGLVFWDVQANKASSSVVAAHVSILSPDARTGVRVEPKGGLTFIDARTGKDTGRLDVAAEHNGIRNGIAFTPDTKILAVVHQNKEVQVREFPGGDLRFSVPLPASAKQAIPGEDHWQYQLSFADGQTLQLGTAGGVVHRWDLTTRKELPPLKKHARPVAGAHTLPDKKTVVTTGEDGLVRRWDRETGKELSEPKGYVGQLHAEYSPNGHLVAAGDGRGRLDLWDAQTGKPLRVLQNEGPAVKKLAFAPDGKSLAAALADSTVHFWTIPDGQEQPVLRCGKEQDLSFTPEMHFSADGRRLMLVDRQYRSRLWDLKTEKICWAGSGRAHLSPDGKTMVAEKVDLIVLDAETGKAGPKLQLNTRGIGSTALAYSPDSKLIAVGRHDGAVHLLRTDNGAEVVQFQATGPRKGIPVEMRRGVLTSVNGLVFSRDARWLCTSGDEGNVRLWEVATGCEVLRLEAHVGRATGVSFGADGRTLLSCGGDAQAYLWSLRPPSAGTAKPSLDSLWTALADEPPVAYGAIWQMSEAKGVSNFLRAKIVPVKPVANERLKKLIDDLNDATFVARATAYKELADLGGVAAPAMRKVLASKPSLEQRRRLEELVEKVETKKLSADELRICRAIDVVARRGTPETRELLNALAAGAPGALTTNEAQAALKRFER